MLPFLSHMLNRKLDQNAFTIVGKVPSYIKLFRFQMQFMQFWYVFSVHMIPWQCKELLKIKILIFYLHIEVFSVFVFVISKYWWLLQSRASIYMRSRIIALWWWGWRTFIWCHKIIYSATATPLRTFLHSDIIIIYCYYYYWNISWWNILDSKIFQK